MGQVEKRCKVKNHSNFISSPPSLTPLHLALPPSPRPHASRICVVPAVLLLLTAALRAGHPALAAAAVKVLGEDGREEEG